MAPGKRSTPDPESANHGYSRRTLVRLDGMHQSVLRWTRLGDSAPSKEMNLQRIKDEIAKNPSLLHRLTDENALLIAKDLIQELDAAYAADPWKWASEVVVTQDEASGESARFPSNREYLHDLFDIFENESLIAIPKSRRVFVTWAVAVYLTHRARYKKNQALFIQSETEDKAAFVVDKRCTFIEENLPIALKRPFRAVRTIKGAVGQMTYEDTKSYIKGIAQGRDALRAFTPSILFLDEIEFQGEGRQSLIAALPFAEKGAKIILVSTSNGAAGPLADIARTVGFVSYRR